MLCPQQISTNCPLFYISIILYSASHIDNIRIGIRYYAQNLFKGKIWPQPQLMYCRHISPWIPESSGTCLSSLHCPSLLLSCSHPGPLILALLGFFQFLEWTLLLPTMNTMAITFVSPLTLTLNVNFLPWSSHLGQVSPSVLSLRSYLFSP